MGFVKVYVFEHVLIAEKALGRYLEPEHPVHHFNEIKADNANTNLVICEDDAYHQLLHFRQRIVAAGGDPDTDKICTKCVMLKSKTEFNCDKSRPDGREARCKSCKKEYDSIQKKLYQPIANAMRRARHAKALLATHGSNN